MANHMAELQRDGVSNRYLPMPRDLPDVTAAKALILSELARLGNVRRVSEATGIHRWQMARWRESDPEFDAAWVQTWEDVKDTHVGHIQRLSEGDGMPAVVANIARLRNLDPAGWSPERQAQVQVHVDARQVYLATDAALGLLAEARRRLADTPADPAPTPDD